MAMGKLKSLEMEILRVAALLSEGDEGLNQEELRRALDSAGIDPAQSTSRFHEAVLRLAEDLRRGGQMAPLSGQEAIHRNRAFGRALPPGSVETLAAFKITCFTVRDHFPRQRSR